jgi:hypothetical protein
MLTVNGRKLQSIPMETHQITDNRRCKVYDFEDGLFLLNHEVFDSVIWKKEKQEWLTKAELTERKYPLQEIEL